MGKKTVGKLIVVLLLGAIVGSALGELIAYLLPSGVVEEFFLRSVHAGFSPVTLNAVLFTFTIGFTFTLNIVGIIGIAIAIYLLRWYF